MFSESVSKSWFSARVLVSAAVGIWLYTTPAVSWAVTHNDKKVGLVYGPDTRDCFFFTLQGITTADPVTPNVAWFAVPRTHLGFKELFSLVVSQKLAGQNINVSTSGQLACGHAEVQALWTNEN